MTSENSTFTNETRWAEGELVHACFLMKASITCLLFAPCFVSLCEGDSLIQVTRSTFCGTVAEREPINIVSEEVQMKRSKELFFWMEYTAGKAALDYLEKHGELPIFHYWRRGIVVTDHPDVGITQEQWLENRDKIRARVEKKGFFTWRTFSYKQNIVPAKYNISVLDANEDAVASVGSNRPLRPEIKISY